MAIRVCIIMNMKAAVKSHSRCWPETQAIEVQVARGIKASRSVAKVSSLFLTKDAIKASRICERRIQKTSF